MTEKRRTSNAIGRRHFLSSAGAVAMAISSEGVSASTGQNGPHSLPENYYPPAKTGLRGSHPGSFEMAHAHAWAGQAPASVNALNEVYDLVVIGAGISGLTAAFRYQQLSDEPRKILILDNHDDFGGQAKRIEFTLDGRTYLTPGGSGFMETPFFSDQSKQLLEDAGVSLSRLEPGQVEDLRLHAFDMPPAVCFDERTFGEAVTIVDDILPLNAREPSGQYRLTKHVEAMPISATDKQSLRQFLETRDDVFAQLNDEERSAALTKMSYNTFVTEYCGLSQSAADAVFTRQTGALLGITSECATLEESLMLSGLPGTHRLGKQGDVLQAKLDAMPGLEGHYAPDGNAIIPRNLVKRLIPNVTDAETMEALTTARFDYSALDHPGNTVRLRLNSLVTNIAFDKTSQPVTATYYNDGGAYSVRAKQAIYAGFHMYLPHLCPQLPDAQKAALSENVKMPFVAVQVCLKDGRAISQLGSASYYFPGRYLHEVVVWGRSLGDHRQDFNIDDPAIVYMIGPVVDAHSGLSPTDQHRLGRHKLLDMPYEDYVQEVKSQLESLFKDVSFDSEKDIAGITVNRWPHGYSRQYNTLFDPDYEDGARPHEVARKRFGPLAIANSDASYVALANTAIDEGLRAAEDLMIGDAL